MMIYFSINASCSSSPSGGNQVDGLPPVIKFGCSSHLVQSSRAQIRKLEGFRSKLLKICAVNFEILFADTIYDIEVWFDPSLSSSLSRGKKKSARERRMLELKLMKKIKIFNDFFWSNIYIGMLFGQCGAFWTSYWWYMAKFRLICNVSKNIKFLEIFDHNIFFSKCKLLFEFLWR